MRHAPKSGVLLEVGANDGTGLLVLATALSTRAAHTDMAETRREFVKDPRAFQGWRLLSLDLPECLDTPDNAFTSGSACIAFLSFCHSLAISLDPPLLPSPLFCTQEP